MDFGIVTAKIDEIGYITHAENLGYTPLLGHRQPDDPVQLLGGAGPGRPADAPDAPRDRRERARAAARAGRGQRHRHHQPPRARALLHRARHRPHRDAHARPEADAPRPVPEYVQTVRALLRGEEVDYTLERRDPSHPLPDARAPLHRPRPLRSRSTSRASARRRRPWPASWATASSPACHAAGTVPEMLANARRGAAAGRARAARGFPHRGHGERGAAAARARPPTPSASSRSAARR